MQAMIARKETVRDALEAARAAQRPESRGDEWDAEKSRIVAKLLRVLEKHNEPECSGLWS